MIIVRTDDAIYTGGEAFYLEKLEYEDEYTVVFANEEAVDITEPLDLEEAKKVLDRIYGPNQSTAEGFTHSNRHERALKEGL